MGSKTMRVKGARSKTSPLRLTPPRNAGRKRFFPESDFTLWGRLRGCRRKKCKESTKSHNIYRGCNRGYSLFFEGRSFRAGR